MAASLLLQKHFCVGLETKAKSTGQQRWRIHRISGCDFVRGSQYSHVELARDFTKASQTYIVYVPFDSRAEFFSFLG